MQSNVPSSVCLSVRASVRRPSVRPPLRPSVHPSVCPSVCPSVRASVSLPRLQLLAPCPSLRTSRSRRLHGKEGSGMSDSVALFQETVRHGIREAHARQANGDPNQSAKALTLDTTRTVCSSVRLSVHTPVKSVRLSARPSVPRSVLVPVCPYVCAYCALRIGRETASTPGELSNVSATA